MKRRDFIATSSVAGAAGAMSLGHAGEASARTFSAPAKAAEGSYLQVVSPFYKTDLEHGANPILKGAAQALSSSQNAVKMAKERHIAHVYEFDKNDATKLKYHYMSWVIPHDDHDVSLLKSNGSGDHQFSSQQTALSFVSMDPMFAMANRSEKIHLAVLKTIENDPNFPDFADIFENLGPASTDEGGFATLKRRYDWAGNYMADDDGNVFHHFQMHPSLQKPYNGLLSSVRQTIINDPELGPQIFPSEVKAKYDGQIPDEQNPTLTLTADNAAVGDVRYTFMGGSDVGDRKFSFEGLDFEMEDQQSGDGDPDDYGVTYMRLKVTNNWPRFVNIYMAYQREDGTFIYPNGYVVARSEKAFKKLTDPNICYIEDLGNLDESDFDTTNVLGLSSRSDGYTMWLYPFGDSLSTKEEQALDSHLQQCPTSVGPDAGMSDQTWDKNISHFRVPILPETFKMQIIVAGYSKKDDKDMIAGTYVPPGTLLFEEDPQIPFLKKDNKILGVTSGTYKSRQQATAQIMSNILHQQLTMTLALGAGMTVGLSVLMSGWGAMNAGVRTEMKEAIASALFRNRSVVEDVGAAALDTENLLGAKDTIKSIAEALKKETETEVYSTLIGEKSEFDKFITAVESLPSDGSDGGRTAGVNAATEYLKNLRKTLLENKALPTLGEKGHIRRAIDLASKQKDESIKAITNILKEDVDPITNFAAIVNHVVDSGKSMTENVKTFDKFAKWYCTDVLGEPTLKGQILAILVQGGFCAYLGVISRKKNVSDTDIKNVSEGYVEGGASDTVKDAFYWSQMAFPLAVGIGTAVATSLGVMTGGAALVLAPLIDGICWAITSAPELHMMDQMNQSANNFAPRAAGLTLYATHDLTLKMDFERVDKDGHNIPCFPLAQNVVYLVKCSGGPILTPIVIVRKIPNEISSNPNKNITMDPFVFDRSTPNVAGVPISGEITFDCRAFSVSDDLFKKDDLKESDINYTNAFKIGEGRVENFTNDAFHFSDPAQFPVLKVKRVPVDITSFVGYNRGSTLIHNTSTNDYDWRSDIVDGAAPSAGTQFTAQSVGDSDIAKYTSIDFHYDTAGNGNIVYKWANSLDDNAEKTQTIVQTASGISVYSNSQMNFHSVQFVKNSGKAGGQPLAVVSTINRETSAEEFYIYPYAKTSRGNYAIDARTDSCYGRPLGNAHEWVVDNNAQMVYGMNTDFHSVQFLNAPTPSATRNAGIACGLGSKIGKLNTPRQIITCEKNLVHVLDYGNNRVHSFDKNLNPVGLYNDKNGMKIPVMIYDCTEHAKVIRIGKTPLGQTCVLYQSTSATAQSNFATSPSDFYIKIYDDNMDVVTTIENTNVADFVFDNWSTLYTLNLAPLTVDNTSDLVTNASSHHEPSVSIWTPKVNK